MNWKRRLLTWTSECTRCNDMEILRWTCNVRFARTDGNQAERLVERTTRRALKEEESERKQQGGEKVNNRGGSRSVISVSPPPPLQRHVLVSIADVIRWRTGCNGSPVARASIIHRSIRKCRHVQSDDAFRKRNVTIRGGRVGRRWTHRRVYVTTIRRFFTMKPRGDRETLSWLFLACTDHHSLLFVELSIRVL